MGPGMDQEERNKTLTQKKRAGSLWAKRVFASSLSMPECFPPSLLSPIPRLFPFTSSFSFIQSFHVGTLSHASFDCTMSCPAKGYLNRVIKGDIGEPVFVMDTTFPSAQQH